MTDPAGAIVLIVLLLLPPAVVLVVVNCQMDRLRLLFTEEIAKLREELLPKLEPERQLLPQIEVLKATIQALSERVTHMEGMLLSRSLDEQPRRTAENPL